MSNANVNTSNIGITPSKVTGAQWAAANQGAVTATVHSRQSLPTLTAGNFVPLSGSTTSYQNPKLNPGGLGANGLDGMLAVGGMNATSSSSLNPASHLIDPFISSPHAVTSSHSQIHIQPTSQGNQVHPAVNMIPSSSGASSSEQDNARHEQTVEHFARAEQDMEEEEESEEASVSASESSSVGSREKDSEADEPDVGETQSAISKVSNRSSPSVLSATIHQWPGYEEESHGLLENNEEVTEESENEDVDDPWRILPEQRGWYLSLFLRLQPDVHGFIEGKDARVFFENSQLPLQDLGEIWNCSDVDRDGRLTLAEFCYAMHLSVARRHGMTLPPHLPNSLRNSTKFVLKAALEHTHLPGSIPVGDHTHQTEVPVTDVYLQWTKFSESPRNRGPVQFRSTLEDENSNLPHPVAVKGPIKSALSTQSTPRTSSAVRDARSYSAGTVGMPNSLSLAAAGLMQVTSGSTQGPVVAGSGHEGDVVMAPPPPPRSWHSRSASLDLQGQVQSQTQQVQAKSSGQHPVGGTAAPPQLPPRSSPIISRRMDSNTSESENESRQPSGSILSASGSNSEMKPEKPPRVTKTPIKNVSFAPVSSSATAVSHSSHDNVGWDRTGCSSLPATLDLAFGTIPTVTDLEKMKATEITNLIQRLKNAVHGLSKQNGDLQQQLTEVVLKKRTAEAHLASERNAQQKS